jgi:hypothetical protein
MFGTAARDFERRNCSTARSTEMLRWALPTAAETETMRG